VKEAWEEKLLIHLSSFEFERRGGFLEILATLSSVQGVAIPLYVEI